MSFTWFIAADGVLHHGRSVVLPNGSIALETPGAQPFYRASALVNASPDVRIVLLAPWLRCMSRAMLRKQLPPWMRPLVVDVIDTGSALDAAQGSSGGGTWPAIEEYVRDRRIQSWVALVPDDSGWPDDPAVRERLFAFPLSIGLADSVVVGAFFKRLRELEHTASRAYVVSISVSDTRPRVIAVQERLLMRVWMPGYDKVEDVDIIVHDEQTAETYEYQLKDAVGAPLLQFVIHCFCLAFWRQALIPSDDESTYPWSEATLEIRTGGGLVPRPLFRLSIAVETQEFRVVRGWTDDDAAVVWRDYVHERDALQTLFHELERAQAS